MLRGLKSKRKKKDKDIQFYLNNNHKIGPDKESIIIAGIYGIFGFSWIVLSDKILDIMTENFNFYSEIQTCKGWIYVLITMGLIYLLVRKKAKLFHSSIKTIRESYEELQVTYEELLATEDELIYQKNFIENIIKDSQVVIGTWDEEGRIRSLNPFGQRLFSYSEEEIINKKWIDILVSSENKSLMVDVLNEIKENKQLKNHECEFITKDNKKKNILWNSSVLNSDRDSEIFVSVGADITNHKSLEKKLKNITYCDNLTGLPNRRFLEDEVNTLVKKNTLFALAFMDIDNFKYINDTLGHAAGDLFLNYIANKLQQVVKQPNVLVRVSGGKYAILFKGIGTKAEIERELKKIIYHIGRTWKVNNYEFFISFSLGISIFPEHGQRQATLLRNADIAMFKAKQTCKGGYLFYTEEFSKDKLQNVKMASELQYAIDNEELTLYYQPQFNLSTGEVIGMEALLRWKHPERGFISPSEFIPLAEKTGQVYDIDKWVISSVLLQKKKFEKQGFNNIDISINLSCKTLMNDFSFNEIEALISSFDIDYSAITIEITETVVISDVEFAIERLHKLKALGLKIALDDFGTGYSSLTHLKKLPMDIVKLDRSFVNRIEEHCKDAVIIKSLLYLARDLKYKVVAEGIETKEQLEYLKKYNCECGQGYLMARPLHVKDVEDMLKLHLNCITNSIEL